MNWKEFDRSLEDFRDAVAKADLTMNDSVKRYIAMMDAIETMALLYYGDYPKKDQLALKTALKKLIDAVSSYIMDDDEQESNVHQIKREPG